MLWATGFRPDHSWLDIPVRDSGHIRHDGGGSQLLQDSAREGTGNLAAPNALAVKPRDSHGCSVAPVGRAPVASP